MNHTPSSTHVVEAGKTVEQGEKHEFDNVEAPSCAHIVKLTGPPVAPSLAE